MHIKTVDGNVYFATHVIHVVGDISKLHRNFQCENEGIVCYSDDELSNVEQELKTQGLEYTTEAMSQDQTVKDKAMGHKYSSRSEAIAHLKDNIEPEHIQFKRIIRENDELKAELASIKGILARNKLE